MLLSVCCFMFYSKFQHCYRHAPVQAASVSDTASALDILYGSYLQPEGTGCLVPQELEHPVHRLLSAAVYPGLCRHWTGRGSCSDSCRFTGSHKGDFANVYACLWNRLPLDDRPEVQVGLLAPGGLSLLLHVSRVRNPSGIPYSVLPWLLSSQYVAAAHVVRDESNL